MKGLVDVLWLTKGEIAGTIRMMTIMVI